MILAEDEYRLSKGKMITIAGLLIFIVGIIGLTWLIFGNFYSVYVDFFTVLYNAITGNSSYFAFLLVVIIGGIVIALAGMNLEKKRLRH